MFNELTAAQALKRFATITTNVYQPKQKSKLFFPGEKAIRNALHFLKQKLKLPCFRSGAPEYR